MDAGRMNGRDLYCGLLGLPRDRDGIVVTER